MSFGHEAYDAELAAAAHGLLLLTRRGEIGKSYTLFTDSTAAMVMLASDAPGPGQETAPRTNGPRRSLTRATPSLSGGPRPTGELRGTNRLYRHPGRTWLAIHSAEARDLASVADLDI